jgi:flavin-dependent dehydrogenase
MYDAAVIGGSLAGAATALHLATTGYRVVVLEQSALYVRKACGEGLFPRGVRELSRLGLLKDVRPLAAPLQGVRFVAGREKVAARFADIHWSGLGVERSRLDPLLLERARQAGAEIRRGVAMQSLLFDGESVAGVRTSQGDIPARFVVGADGLGSRVRRQAGLDRQQRSDRYGVSAHVQLECEPEPFIEVHFRAGYEIYVTPVGLRTINVAVLLNKRLLSRIRGALQGWFTFMVDRVLGSAGHTIVDSARAAGPFGRACTQSWRRNLALVGDAAGFWDAISGEGMSSALISARYCAAAIDAYLLGKGEQALRLYGARRAKLIRNSDLLARLTLALASKPAVARRAVHQLARQPETFGRLISISAGDLPLHALRPSDAVTLLPAF